MTVFSKLMRNSSSQSIASRSKWFVGSSKSRMSGLPKSAYASRTFAFAAEGMSAICEP